MTSIRDQWISDFRNSERGGLALKRLKELDHGDLESFSKLEESILFACYHAYRFSEFPQADMFEKTYQEGRLFDEAIDDLLKAALRLKRAAEGLPIPLGTALKSARNRLVLTRDEQSNGPFGLTVAFADLMDRFVQGVKQVGEENLFVVGSIVGCLDYGEDIRSKRSADYALNGMLFELAYIFRTWTRGARSGISLSIPGAMPTEGRPCFPMIEVFVRATFGESKASILTTDATALMDRLKKMLKTYPSLKYIGWDS